MRKQQGFTLIEVLVAIVLMSVILTLSATAVRHFWFVRSLEGGADEVVTQLRRQQARAVSESHPLVYGARFTVGQSTWSLVSYDPAQPLGSQCSVTQTRTFDTGVTVVGEEDEGTEFASSNVTTTCASDLSATANDHFVFFFARGDATAGKVVLNQPQLGRQKTVTVSGLTARVDGS